MRIDLPSEFFYEDKVTPTEHSGGALPVDDISTSEPAVAAITEASEKNRSRHGLIGASSSSSSGDSAEEKELEAMFRAARGGEQGPESRAARDSSSDASSDGGQNFHNFPSALTSIPREVGDDEGGTDGVWRWTVERAATAGEGGLDMVPMCGDASTGDKEAAVPPVSRRKIKVCPRLCLLKTLNSLTWNGLWDRLPITWLKNIMEMNHVKDICCRLRSQATS